ncbi:hypothetical protein GWE18_00810 [Bradyrhizobium sp. CSA112]|nr:hypothetical protein [Bradyrhizobium sp. CSA112]
MNTGPVQPIPKDDENRTPEPSSALCLSGGGYRAMVFHIGVLWHLYETGLLQNIKRISSVSGGSITAGHLVLAWRNLSDATTQERLINWGYAVCDAALRKHLDSELKPKPVFPYPQSGV